jgi:hypothetical protein
MCTRRDLIAGVGRARLPYAENPVSCEARVCVLGPCLHAGCARAAWVGVGSRGNDLGAGGLCLAPLVGGGSFVTL